jgi:hypothetical protein
MTLLDDICTRLGALPEKEREEVKAAAIKATAGMRWLPSPGPQTQAFFHPADVLLYGGQGGGGKSDLLLGLAMTEHRRSLILRRKYANLSALTERAIEIYGSRDGYNGSPPPLLRTKDGHYIQFAGNQHLGDEQDWQGHPFDFKGFDEATQFLEQQVRFHLGWLRSTDEGQRVRAVLATNPPVSAEGDWIIGMFRPWLDITHPKPAKHGELRWYVTAPDGADVEVPGPEPVQLPGADRPAIPMSRSFIPAALSDNPFLINSGYQAKLDGLPEPLRSAVRDGNFMAVRQDDEYQVIPTQWIIEAQSRWREDGFKTFAMTALAIDPAGGGRDAAELCWRHGGWYAPFVSIKGEATADETSAAQVFLYRRDNAPVVVDVGGGWGDKVILRLKDNGMTYVSFNGANKSLATTIGGNLPFQNMRAEAWWKFREALDPNQDGGSIIALPPDPELRSDLAAVCLEPRALERGHVLIESKEDLRKRLGRSPGKGDAAVMCLTGGNAAVRKHLRGSTPMPKVNLGYSRLKNRR